MDYLRNLLQKKVNNSKDDDLKKIELLNEMLSDDEIFMKIDMDTAIGILDYLGVPKEKIRDVYIDLICNNADLKKDSKQFYIPRD